MGDPEVSVIVPVRNGGADVRRLVDALERQTLPRSRFEVLVVDDGSTDGATGGLDSADGWLRVLPGPPRNSYAARNRGARAAVAPLLAFCDVDCVPEPGWLEAGFAAAATADLVAGLVRFALPDRPSVWTLIDVESALDQASMVLEGIAVTANLFVSRELLETRGGFDERYASGGDWTFVRGSVEAGAALRFAPEAIVVHRSRDDARSSLRKVWFRERWASTRRTERGHRPGLVDALVGHRRASWRRGLGRPGRGLDPRRLEEHGLTVSRPQGALAVLVRAALFPPVLFAARLVGWVDGLRRRRAGTSQEQA